MAVEHLDGLDDVDPVATYVVPNYTRRERKIIKTNTGNKDAKSPSLLLFAKLVSSKQIPRVDFLLHVIEATVITVGDDRVRHLLEPL